MDGSGKCYKAVPQAMNWFDADVFCKNSATNAYLTSITSAFENANVNAEASAYANCTQFWIGGNDINQKGKFAWTDGQPFAYVSWASGQPNANDQCVSSDARVSGQWKTESCSRTNCFICASYAAPPTTTLPPPTSPSGMSDCYDWYRYGGARTDGVYRLSPPGIAPFDAYCDMTTDNGGWTVFQQRRDNTTSFWDRTWAEYKNGFGNINQNNSWLGLDRLHVLSTKNPNVTLRIELHGNRCPMYYCYRSGVVDPAAWWWAEWYFKVGAEVDFYRLNVSLSTRGSLTSRNSNDNLWGFNNGQPFSTIDRDNDNVAENCASAGSLRLGGWWHGSCSGGCRPNGKYNMPAWETGFSWYTGRDNNAWWISPNQSEMKLRRN
uniref:Fibrinogen C-terminal domain-containing protein n=1 Tax=Plectus sambesii TaxID=2011161 RepID=A0A914WPQ2_9BILA